MPAVTWPWAVGAGVGFTCSPHFLLCYHLWEAWGNEACGGRRASLPGPGVLSSDSDFVEGPELAPGGAEFALSWRELVSGRRAWASVWGSGMEQRVCKVKASLSAPSPHPGCSSNLS